MLTWPVTADSLNRQLRTVAFGRRREGLEEQEKSSSSVNTVRAWWPESLETDRGQHRERLTEYGRYWH